MNDNQQINDNYIVSLFFTSKTNPNRIRKTTSYIIDNNEDIKNYLINRFSDFRNDFKGLTFYGQPWYLHLDKYPNNFGLSPKLFVVTDIIFCRRQIYESNCDLFNIEKSMIYNYYL